DPELAEAHAILGVVRSLWLWKWDAGQREIDTAMRINPRSPQVLIAFALHLVFRRRFKEAVTMAQRAVELDPLGPVWGETLSLVYWFGGRYDECIRQTEATLDVTPNYWLAYLWRGMSYAALGRWTEAVADLELARTHSGDCPYVVGWHGFVLAKAGRRDEAVAQLRALLERAEKRDVPAVSVAPIYAGLDDRNAAMTWLERACAHQEPWVVHNLSAPLICDGLRSDPRFADLHRRVFGT
ncbi:MAG: tetratricopeptide repeat protein, partial [Longimicrobiales bacterium]